MVRKKNYIYAVSLCFVCMGCSQATDMDEPGEAVPVQFSAASLPTSTRAAIDGGSFAEGALVTIYGVSQATADYAESQWTATPFMNNKTATVGTEGKLIYSPIQFFQPSEKYSFFSVFKGKAEESGVRIDSPEAGKAPILTVNLQSSSLFQADVMLASAKNETKASARNGMVFTFEHLLTQIRFNVAKAATYTKEAKLTKVTVNSLTEATTSIDNTTLNPIGSKSDVELVDCTASPLILTGDQQTLVQTGGTDPAYAMLFPGKANAVVFTFTVNDKDYSLTLKEDTWGKGVIYTYDITFDKALKLIVTGWSSETWGVEIGGTSVLDASDWNDGGTLDKEVL